MMTDSGDDDDDDDDNDGGDGSDRQNSILLQYAMYITRRQFSA